MEISLKGKLTFEVYDLFEILALSLGLIITPDLVDLIDQENVKRAAGISENNIIYGLDTFWAYWLRILAPICMTCAFFTTLKGFSREQSSIIPDIFMRSLYDTSVMIGLMLLSCFLFSVSFTFLYLNFKGFKEPDGNDIETYFYNEDIGQYGSIDSLNSFWNTFKFAFLGDLDFNNYDNMINKPLSFITAILVTIFVPIIGTNTLIAIIGKSYEEVLKNESGRILRNKMKMVVQYELFKCFFKTLYYGYGYAYENNILNGEYCYEYSYDSKKKEQAT